MLKKIFLVLVVIILGAGAWVYISFFSGATGFKGKHKYFYIYSDRANKSAILGDLVKDSIINMPSSFTIAANRLDYWQHIKPGRYKIEKGTSIFKLVRMLRNGRQEPVKLVINKLRLPQDFARLIGKNFETDSADMMQYLQQLPAQQETAIPGSAMYHIIPNTYEFVWNTSADKIMKRLSGEYDKWWKRNNRKAKADSLGLSPDEVHTIASIVEEETNHPEDRGKVASVYMNRLKQHMPLQADPTIRFALDDFTMNRVHYKHLKVASAYNTYTHTGLPPGPICLPYAKTIDAVLDAPKTDYLFFVADADLRGGSTFTTNLKDHSKAAKLYQDSLSAWQARKLLKAKQDSISKAGK